MHFTAEEVGAARCPSSIIFQLLAKTGYSEAYVIAPELLCLSDDPGVIFVFAYEQQEMELESRLQEQADTQFPEGLIRRALDAYSSCTVWRKRGIAKALQPARLFTEYPRARIIQNDLYTHMYISGANDVRISKQLSLIHWTLDTETSLDFEGFRAHRIYGDPEQYLERKRTEVSAHFPDLVSSLGETCGREVHPLAELARKDFVRWRQRLADELYHAFNRAVFVGNLPANMQIKWNKRLICTAGQFVSNETDMNSYIELSPSLCLDPARLRDVLLHELCHAAVFYFNDNKDTGIHGNLFFSYAKEGSKVYPFLPPVTSCHKYPVHRKYVYRCTVCGYKYERCYRSINVNKRMCQCLGTLVGPELQ